MPLDLMVPFGVLFALVIYFMFTRQKFEKGIVDIYEEKFTQWKKHNPSDESLEKKECKELVGLVFKTGYNVDIELFDEKAEDRISRGKFKTKLNKK